MITNRVLGNVLLGVNEQVNCNDCISAFGSAGSFSAGIHGRKNLTPNLSLHAGIAYAQYGEGGYHVTSSPIGAFALRYDFVDWRSSRPFFDIGTILSPFQKVRYARSYTTSLGAVSLESSTTSENYAVYGRAGWMSRLSPRDEVAASVEVWQLWQRVKGYTDPAAAFNPFDASIATGTDRTTLDILSQRGQTIVNLQEGAASVCTVSFECIQLTRPGDTAIITSSGGKSTIKKTNNPPWTFAATCGAAAGLCSTTQYADASPVIVDDGSDPTGMLCGR